MNKEHIIRRGVVSLSGEPLSIPCDWKSLFESEAGPLPSGLLNDLGIIQARFEPLPSPEHPLAPAWGEIWCLAAATKLPTRSWLQISHGSLQLQSTDSPIDVVRRRPGLQSSMRLAPNTRIELAAGDLFSLQAPIGATLLVRNQDAQILFATNQERRRAPISLTPRLVTAVRALIREPDAGEHNGTAKQKEAA